MEKINVHDDIKDTEETLILKETSLFSNELENALKETITIEKEYKEGKRKGYNNAKKMVESIID